MATSTVCMRCMVLQMTEPRRWIPVVIIIGVIIVIVVAVAIFLNFAYGSHLSVDCDESAPPDCFSMDSHLGELAA